MSLAFTRDGKQIVGPSCGGAHVWDVASGEVVDTYGGAGGTGGANSDLVIDRRGLAFFTSGDGTVTVWDPEGARRVGREFPTTDDSMACPDAGLLRSPTRTVRSMAASLGDGRTALRDPRSGRFVDILPARDGTVARACPRSSPAAAGWRPAAATGP